MKMKRKGLLQVVVALTADGIHYPMMAVGQKWWTSQSRDRIQRKEGPLIIDCTEEHYWNQNIAELMQSAQNNNGS